MGAVSDVYAYLGAQGIAGGSTGWSLLRRQVSDAAGVLDQLVVVSDDGGATPEMAAAVGIGDAAFGDAGVLITVRAGEHDGDASQAKAEEILAALHGQFGVLIGSTTYLRVRALTAEPTFAGFDDRGRPLHTLGVRMLRAVSPVSS